MTHEQKVRICDKFFSYNKELTDDYEDDFRAAVNADDEFTAMHILGKVIDKHTSRQISLRKVITAFGKDLYIKGTELEAQDVAFGLQLCVSPKRSGETK